MANENDTSIVDDVADSPSPSPGPAPSPTPSPASVKVTTTPATAKAPAPAPTADDKPGYWPGDWREKVSAGDEKVLNQLSRYATPAEVSKALLAAQSKIRSGELKPVLSKEAKPEELKEWRTAHGIPETPDKYDTDLGKGFVIGDEDKPLVAKFLEAAHGTNQTPDQVKASLRAYYDVTEQLNGQRAETDRKIQETAEEELRTEWGTEYRRNINLGVQMLDGVMDQDTKTDFLHGRLADGTPIGSAPKVLKALLSLALQQNPTGVLVPSGGGPTAVEDEIAKIENTMKTNRDAYNKDEKMQLRLRSLYEARETLSKGRN